jgi:hypothetical protein
VSRRGTWTRRRLLGLLPAVAALPGCGYALVGRGVTTDPSIKRIGVPLFKDATGKPTLDQKITQRVIEELLKRGRFDVVQERSGVDAVVEGEIVRYDAVPVGFTGTVGQAGATGTQASRYAITLTARVRYAKTDATEPIWANDTFQSRDEYDLGSDPATFTDRETQALDRLATTFARNLVAEMLEAF